MHQVIPSIHSLVIALIESDSILSVSVIIIFLAAPLAALGLVMGRGSMRGKLSEHVDKSNEEWSSKAS
ncbi:MAG: hypothetical protein MN733_21650 [Nitrososphaera sp.]|nr:hypothetical protein [Nitrososphaera sp.]